MENRYSSYEPEPREYPPQYTEREYNNYPTEYEMDNSKKSYKNDYYEQPEHQSYQPDYNEEYPKYVKDNNGFKSKKDSSTLNINKVNCINNNVNINGNNTGDINVGNSGSSASSQGTGEEYIGIGSSGGYDEGYNDGYNKQKDKDFACIINNNNINNNFGNATDGNGITPEPPTACELCFANANVVEAIEATLELPGSISFEGIVDAEDIGAEVLTIEDFCEYIEEQNFGDFTLLLILRELVDDTAGISDESLQAIIDCLILAGVVIND